MFSLWLDFMSQFKEEKPRPHTRSAYIMILNHHWSIIKLGAKHLGAIGTKSVSCVSESLLFHLAVGQ